MKPFAKKSDVENAKDAKKPFSSKNLANAKKVALPIGDKRAAAKLAFKKKTAKK